MFHLPIKLHVRNHDSSFNPRYLQINIFAETLQEVDYLYHKINLYAVNFSDTLKAKGIEPEEIYWILMEEVREKFRFDSFVTENHQVFKFAFMDCVPKNFNQSLKKLNK